MSKHKPAKHHKPQKFFDIVAPGKSAPTVGSRPIISSSEPLQPDPMMTESAEEIVKPTQPAEITIETSTSEPEPAEVQQPESVPVENAPEPSAENVESTAEPESKPEVDSPVPEQNTESTPDEDHGSLQFHKQKFNKSEDESNYVVSFHHSKAYRLRKTLIWLLAIVIVAALAVAALDMAVDSGLLKVTTSLPHTNFFK